MAAVDLTTHPGHLARRLQRRAHYLLWNTMVSEETTSPGSRSSTRAGRRRAWTSARWGRQVGLDRSTIAGDQPARPSRVAGRMRPAGRPSFLLRATDEGLRVHRKLTVRTAPEPGLPRPLSADEGRPSSSDLIRRVADAPPSSATRPAAAPS